MSLECNLFSRMCLYFDILVWSPPSNLWSSLLLSLLKSMYVLFHMWLYAGFISNVFWYVMQFLLATPDNLLIYTFFDTKIIYLQNWFFKVLINLSTITDFSSLSAEYISISLSCSLDLINLIFCLVFNLIHLRFLKGTSYCHTFFCLLKENPSCIYWKYQ